MKKIKKHLSIFLCILMVFSAIPVTSITAFAASWDRTDFSVDFDYEFNTPEEALQNAKNINYIKNFDKDGSIVWQHADCLDDEYTDKKTDLRYLLSSENEDNKYIVLDRDCKTTTGYDSDGSIVIRSDKIIDLNGHKIVWKDIRNKHDTHNERKENYSQSTGSEGFNEIFISIEGGATVTIIDSSETEENPGTGEIYYDAYMINPFDFNIRKYTTRDVFWVNDGNLIVYGGKIQAGRSKQHSDEGDIFDEITTVIGDAVCLATDVAGYATGINSAVGKFDDISFNVNTALEELKKQNSDSDKDTAESSEDAAKNENIGSTDKKTGADSVKETVKDNPLNTDGRNQTVDEKQNEKDKKQSSTTDNKSNKNGTAKEYDGNSKIAEAKNAVVNAAVNKDKISAMVSSAVKLGKSIKGMFVSDCDCFATQTLLGTCVHVGNKGTFVSYGGQYIGYGMTPNVRNATIEVTKLGKIYIFDGKFEGRCGANIFNITEAAGSTPIYKTQYLATSSTDDDDVVDNAVQVELKPEETGGLRIIDLNADGTLVNTSNILVRGGTFVNSYEYNMIGLHESKTEGGTDHDGENMTLFPGSSGCVNLGVESYDEDYIRDGRIQIVDNYGDGALVLMDEEKQSVTSDSGTEQSVYHYRLFCQDDELRNKRYLTVYPNTDIEANSTFSFALQTRYGNTDSSTYDDQSKAWNGESSTEDGIFSQNELYFTYPIDSKYSEKYYVVPELSDTNPYGEDLETSNVWYYKTPTSKTGEKLNSFSDELTSCLGVARNGDYETVYGEKSSSLSTWKNIEDKFERSSITYQHKNFQYGAGIKWFTYKIYRVDPLTRESISESSTYGVDVPLKEVVYGCSNESIRCRLQLNQLGIDYQPGEMYRIVLSVDEYVEYGEGVSKKLSTASCTSSICFMCYSSSEKKQQGDIFVEDPTPLQWVTEPKAGQTATVSIVNGKAGQVDLNTKKIFDIYYQWYVCGENGEPDELIAGTNNVYTGDLAGLKYHKFESFNPEVDGYIYKNTVDPDDANANAYGDNGLPQSTDDWTAEMLHTYTESDTRDNTLKKVESENLSLGNNNAFKTGTDECYIPEEYGGRTIYCKCIAVNTYWPKNFDHVQVFYTHKIQLAEAEVKPVVTKLSASFDGDYATSENQIKIDFTSIENLRLNRGEYINKIIYYIKGTKNTVKLTKDNLNVKSANDIPQVFFPRDFYKSGVDFNTLIGFEDAKIYAKVFTNMRTDDYDWSNVVNADYEIPAQSYAINKDADYYYDDVYHVSDTHAADGFYVSVYPEHATIGGNFSNGDNFTSSDPEVATLDENGKLVLGGNCGNTVITVYNPDYTSNSIIICVPVKEVNVSGIVAPEIGEVLSTDVGIPDNANFYVSDVYWTANSSSAKLAAGTRATYFKNYTCHIVIEELGGYEFYSYNSSDEPFYEVDYTLSLDDGAVKKGTAYPETVEGNRQFELQYKFDAVADESANVIDTVMINFPTENIAQGDSVEEWQNKSSVICAAGDSVVTTITPSLVSGASEVYEAYGYSGFAEKSTVFMKGVQGGAFVTVKIPSDISSVLSFADTLDVYVNGVKTNAVVNKIGDTQREITVTDAYTVEDGDAITFAPKVEKSNISIAVGQTVNIWDYISFEDGTDIYNGKPTYTYLQDEGYFEIDSENGSITGLVPTGYWSQQIEMRVYHDANCRGERLMAQTYSFDVKVYNTVGDIPEDTTQKAYSLNITAKNPDGTTAYESVTDTKELNFSEVDGAFISNITCSNSSTFFQWNNGANRIVIFNAPTTDSDVIVETVAADVTIHPGCADAYADAGNVEGILYSLDGVCWSSSNHLRNLQPETEYTLYYKQGYNGTVYRTAFITDTICYGYISQIPITDNNLGILEVDGWHYDPDINTLTLKNYTTYGKGSDMISDTFSGFTVDLDGIICLPFGGVIELLGNNEIKEKSSFCNIYSGGELSIIGNGDLTLIGSTCPVRVDGGDLYLEGSGNLTIRKSYSGIYVTDGDAYYRNGSILFCGSEYGGNCYGGKLMGDGSFNVDEASHTMKYYNITKDGNYIAFANILNDANLAEVTESAFLSNTTADNKILYISPVHVCNKTYQSSYFLKSGSCETGCEYYKSCSCGYTDKSSSFTVSAHSHSLTPYAKKLATCVTDGYEAYSVCVSCNYNTFSKIPATEHEFIHYEGKTPTCTESGYKDYDECENCRKSTYCEIPATGHNLVVHSGKAATCSSVGWNQYEACTECDYTTYTEIPKTSHENTYELVAKKATCAEDGVKQTRCTLCEEVISSEAISSNVSAHCMGQKRISSCSEKSYIHHYCAYCDYQYDDNYSTEKSHYFHNGKCDYCGLKKTDFFQTEHNYKTNKTYNWSVVKTGATSVIIKFSSRTAVEDGNDIIVITDKNGTFRNEYTGTELAYRTVEVPGDTVNVSLVSNGSVTAYGLYVTKVVPVYDGVAPKAESKIDHTESIIISKKKTSAVTDILDLSNQFSATATPFVGTYLGTGSTVNLAYSGESINEYTVILEGDLNGDGVSDVLDATFAERVANCHTTATKEQIYAANGDVSDEIDIMSYQNVINSVLS